MANPYEVPQSVLELETLSLRKKTGWKILFWFYLCLEVISMFFFEDEAVFDIVGEIIVYSFALLGLFAFAYNKKIATPMLWRIVILVVLAWDCYVFISAFIEEDYAGLELFLIIGISIFVALFSFLQYFALYQYAFRSKEIWNKP